jgi:hypothetical protein
MSKKELLRAAKLVSAEHHVKIMLRNQRILYLSTARDGSRVLVWKTRRCVAVDGDIKSYSGSYPAHEDTNDPIGTIKDLPCDACFIGTSVTGEKRLIVLESCGTKCATYELPMDV